MGTETKTSPAPRTKQENAAKSASSELVRDGDSSRDASPPSTPSGPSADGSGVQPSSNHASNVRSRARQHSSKHAEAVSSAVSKEVERFGRRTSRATRELRLKFLDRNQPSEQVVQMHDRLNFTFSILALVAMAFMVGTTPRWYYVFHCIFGCTLIARRWWRFKQKKQHYFLFDFCYFSFGLSILYTTLLNDHPVLFQIFFLCANGPVGWSIPMFSDSLTFHNSARMTSAFLHSSGCVLAFVLRWWAPTVSGNPFKICDEWNCDNADAKTMLFNAYAKFYLPWAVGYYLWVYVLMEERVKSRGYETLFGWVASFKWMQWLKKISPNHFIQKAIYTGLHALYALATMCIALLSWYSYAVHFAFMFFLLTSSAWSASRYYFSMFAARYQEELVKRAKEFDEDRSKGKLLHDSSDESEEGEDDE